jgi:hypothetical protein
MNPTSLPSRDFAQLPSLFDSPEFTRWFLGQSIAFVTVVICLGLWIWTISRQLRDSQRRNEELSNSFTLHVESAMRERLAMAEDSLLRHDSTVRNILTSFADALSKRRESLGPPSGSSSTIRSDFPGRDG